MAKTLKTSLQHEYYWFQEPAITAAAAGATTDMSDAPMGRFALTVDRTAGTAAWSVTLELSTDNGVNWETAVLTHNSTTGDGRSLYATDKPATSMRHNVGTVGSGNTLTVTTLAIK